MSKISINDDNTILQFWDFLFNYLFSEPPNTFPMMGHDDLNLIFKRITI